MSDTFHPEYVQPDAGYDWRCMRCENQWRSNKPGAPKPLQCSKCRSGYWDRPPVRVKKEKLAKVESTSKRKKTGKKTDKPKRPRTSRTAKTLNEKVVFANKDGFHISDGITTDLLAPPPHLRRAYTRPQDEPSPETLIRKPKDEQ